MRKAIYTNKITKETKTLNGVFDVMQALKIKSTAIKLAGWDVKVSDVSVKHKMK